MNARTRSTATLSPASAAAVSLSRTARQFRPTRLRSTLASSTSTISAQLQHTQACHCVSWKFAPRKPGVVTVKSRPWSPPKTPCH